MKKRKTKAPEITWKNKIQAYAILSLFALVIFGIGYWDYRYATTPQESSVIMENLNKQVQPSYVCMIRNGYIGKPLLSVFLNNRMYYGCCSSCIKKLTDQNTNRLAVDPYNGHEIDKSDAYIMLLERKGKVTYFASEETYHAYKLKNQLD